MKYQALLLMLLAIALELLGTTSLKLSNAGARPAWYVLVATGYLGAFYCFSLALRTIPLGIAYAIWAGVGIIGTALIGKALFQQSLSPLAMAGIALIIIGVVFVNASPSQM
jgi:small multidrug resistance pump